MTVNLKKTCILLMLMLELVFLPVKAEATEMVLSQRTITIPTGSSTTISLENYNGKNSVKWRSTFQTVLKVKKINNKWKNMLNYNLNNKRNMLKYNLNNK